MTHATFNLSKTGFCSATSSWDLFLQPLLSLGFPGRPRLRDHARLQQLEPDRELLSGQAGPQVVHVGKTSLLPAFEKGHFSKTQIVSLKRLQHG